MLAFIFAALPIFVLIVVMTMPRPLPSTWAFLVAAGLAYGVGLLYFGRPAILLNAAVLAGLLDAITPITIVFGAICFFVAMEKSGLMKVVQEWLKGISPNPIAQIMIVGWSFLVLIEGACGFGTPAALAAPILVGLGFPALRVAVFCLVANAIPTTFGAVGTPLWFGFQRLELSEQLMIDIGFNTAILQALAALVVPVVALRFIVGWKDIGKNAIFIYLSLLASLIPMGLMALINYEFPAVIGGAIGLGITVLLARSGVGLTKPAEAMEDEAAAKQGLDRSVLVALLPLAITVFILLVTRIPALGLRALLSRRDGGLALDLGSLGQFGVSPSLVLRLENILEQGLNWSHALLYVPSIIPFLLTGAIALMLARKPIALYRETLNETLRRIAKPVLALLGALAFVKLLMVGHGDTPAATMILGQALAGAAGETWIYFAPFLGALGSFFSGSTTLSNLTFGQIQATIAADTGLRPSVLLALQSAGGSMGNMVCIHNIVAVCAVLGLVNVEGKILRLVFPMLLLHGAMLALGVALFYRG